jgi:hypothetical protein
MDPLTDEDRQAIVDDICSALERTYIFADTASEMIGHIRQRLGEGAYDGLDTPIELSDTLTEDLQSISHDLHLRLRFAPPPPDRPGDQMPSPEEIEARMLEQMRRSNFCFERIERLEGNVGYLKLNCFSSADHGGATAVAAMGFLANSDALIFDLRDNGGGSPSMIQLITSYLLSEPTHLNSFYIRESDETRQFWTQAHVQGRRLSEIPVYVLTSGRTFSAAEEFTYNLKNLERATIVGETTGGGAHPVQRHQVEGYPIVMSLPYGRAVNPVTGTNWEGSGVEPDTEVPAAEALLVAHIDAIKTLEKAAEEAGGDEDLRRSLTWSREALEVRQSPVALSLAEMKAYAGSYGPREVAVREDKLFYRRDDLPWLQLIPLGDDRFMLEGVESFRFVFERDPSGTVVRITGHYQDGRIDANHRGSS